MAAKWRWITDKEEQIGKWLSSREVPGVDALREQLETAKVSQVDNEGCLQFRVTGPRAVVERRVPAEAFSYDHGANSRPAVNLLLHVLDGMLNELEVYTDDGSPSRLASMTLTSRSCDYLLDHSFGPPAAVAYARGKTAYPSGLSDRNAHLHRQRPQAEPDRRAASVESWNNQLL